MSGTLPLQPRLVADAASDEVYIPDPGGRRRAMMARMADECGVVHLPWGDVQLVDWPDAWRAQK